MKYYAFEYEVDEFTKSGEPNEVTGFRSTAGLLKIFKSKGNLDNWISEGKPNCLMTNSRARVSVKDARILKHGISVAEFDKLIEEVLES